MTTTDPRQANRLPLGPQFVEQLPPKSNTVMTVVTIVIMVIAFVATLIIMLLALLQSNVPLLGLSIVLALCTLTFVWFVVWFIDRWEPEPKLLLFGALAWGAGISTAGALLFGLVGDVLFPNLPDWWGSVVQAPVVEELFKGLGVLIIFFVARKHFNGPTDGIVFGALSGAGFAFTENILYFSSVAASGFESNAASGVFALGYQFIVRGVALPLLHPICASLTGAAIGWGARRSGTGAAIGGFFIGLIPAMAVHAIWNGGVTIIAETATTAGESITSTILLFLFAMVPIFIGWIIMVIVFRRGDRKLLRERLGEYASVGWYSRAEVEMLSTMRGRSGARDWSKRLGPNAVRAMRDFIEDSSRLAMVRHQVLLDPGNAQKQRNEHELLSDLSRIRRVLNQSQRAGAQQMQTVSSVAMPATAPPRMPTPYMPGQAVPGQQMPGQQMPGQHPGQQMPGQQMPGQQMPGQQFAGQPGPGQPMPGQPGAHQMPGQAGQVFGPGPSHGAPASAAPGQPHAGQPGQGSHPGAPQQGFPGSPGQQQFGQQQVGQQAPGQGGPWPQQPPAGQQQQPASQQPPAGQQQGPVPGPGQPGWGQPGPGQQGPGQPPSQGQRPFGQ